MQAMDDKLVARLNLLNDRLIGKLPSKSPQAVESTATKNKDTDENSAHDVQVEVWKKINKGESDLVSPGSLATSFSSPNMASLNSNIKAKVSSTPSSNNLSGLNVQPPINSASGQKRTSSSGVADDRDMSKHPRIVENNTGNISNKVNSEMAPPITNPNPSSTSTAQLQIIESGHSLSQSSKQGTYIGDESSRQHVQIISGSSNSRGPSGSSSNTNAIAKTKPISSYFSVTSNSVHNNLNGSANSTASTNSGSADTCKDGPVVATTTNNSNEPKNIRKSTLSTPLSAGNNASKSFANAAVNTVNDSEKLTFIMINDLKKQNEHERHVRDLMESKIHRLETDISLNKEHCNALEKKNENLMEKLRIVYKTAAQQEARRKRETIAMECVRLGRILTIRSPASTQFAPELIDVWEEGYALKDLRVKESKLFKRKQELENRKKALASAQRAYSKMMKSRLSMSNDMELSEILNTDSSGAIGTNNPNPFNGMNELELSTEAETVKYHIDQFKIEENMLAEERRLLDSDKASHQKELKRIRNEDESQYTKDLKCLNNRYQLLCLLGKGGFSEVWKALDLIELREVAVKIHKLNVQWNEDKKTNYVKHVTREYQIHRDMSHPRIVQLYDVFEIDDNSFATVLEHCNGIDLDEKLKRNRTLSERDAKAILMQILTGLRYLNTPQMVENVNGSTASNANTNASKEEVTNNQSGSTTVVLDSNNNPKNEQDLGNNNPNAIRRKAIIHYDLKPANILFDSFGDVKITDFGLSKVIDDSTSSTDSVELTSIGAGTYWYLPPECFMPQTGASNQMPKNAPRISSKVDVWSVGVIFYQMLYGRRPFGEGKSQEVILKEGTILSARQVEFPTPIPGNSNSNISIPKVSDEAKEFIRACLERDQTYRPDVHALCQHPYLKRK